MYLFVLVGHWLGLLWFAIAVKPLERATVNDTSVVWLWNEASVPYDPAYAQGTLYVCSLYWALSVMTNLKGPPAHESREWYVPSSDSTRACVVLAPCFPLLSPHPLTPTASLSAPPPRSPPSRPPFPHPNPPSLLHTQPLLQARRGGPAAGALLHDHGLHCRRRLLSAP